MFTGIVEELGEVVRLDWFGEGAVLAVRGPTVTADARHGDSIAVSGVCLTVTSVTGDVFVADVMKETFDRSALGKVAIGDRVNLERAVTPSTRLGGHIVQGHVDGVGRVLSREVTAGTTCASRCRRRSTGTWSRRDPSVWTAFRSPWWRSTTSRSRSA
jgi:riboflavin synthase